VLLTPILSAVGSSVVNAAAAGPKVAVIWSPVNTRDYMVAYEEWVEQFGAQAVVISEEQGDVDAVFDADAMILPGGPTMVMSDWLRRVLDRAVQVNARGRYFPVWGTCLGFQMLIEFVGGIDAIEHNQWADFDHPSNIEFTAAAPGRLFAGANESLKQWFISAHADYENHHDGIAPASFASNPRLSDFFNLLATGADRKGNPFVAAVEGRHLPFYGIQFHPEKTPFSVSDHVPVSPQAYAVSHYLASFVVSEAKRGRSMQPSPVSEVAIEADIAAWTRDCLPGSSALCSCQELEAKRFLDAATCEKDAPSPAIAFCRTFGPCQGSVERILFA